MSVTLIEFFDKSPLENIVSSLMIHPEKVIFITSQKKQTDKQIDHYKKLFECKGLTTEIECCTVKKNDAQNIKEALFNIINKNPNCMIDMTGGDELSLAVVGAITDFIKTNNVTTHRVNINTQKIIEFFDTSINIELHEPELSVKENIILHGGAVVKETDWDWNQTLIKDIDKMWEICKLDCINWNLHTSEFSKWTQDNSLNVVISKKNGFMDFNWDNRLLRMLSNNKLIYNLNENYDSLSFNYKNKQICNCLTKAGLILELKTYLLSKGLMDSNNTQYFNDVMTSVNIDWDGVIHQSGDNYKDTKNEIDVITIKGLIPLFISCKNGYVSEEELYKLNTVADRFGGNYVKKVLIATYIDKNESSIGYFRQRAKDMNITLIEGVHQFTNEEFAKKIKSIV